MITESYFAIVLALIFTIDAFGMIPIYLHLTRKLSPKKRFYITLRELFFGLLIMILFQQLGGGLLTLLDLKNTTVKIAAGIVLFFIAIQLIFKKSEEKLSMWKEGPLFIVPLATPLIAGPSVLSVIMLLSQNSFSKWKEVGVISLAWGVTAIITLFSSPIYRVLGDKGLLAIEKLMGLIIALMAVQILLEGIQQITSNSL